MQTKPLIIALLAVFTNAVPAAEPVAELSVVRVTAPRPDTRSLFATTLGAEAISPLLPATRDTASLLRDLPGVSLYGAGGVSSLPVIRGLADERLRIQVDGMDLLAACPNHMNPALSYIDPTRVERVQVYAGVSPVSLGGDALGGAILVESAPAPFAPAGEEALRLAEMGAYYRSNGEARGGHLRAAQGRADFAVAYDGAYAKADNYKAGKAFKDYTFTGRAGHTLALDEVGSSAYETANHALSLAWRNADHLVDLRYLRQQTPFQGYPNQRMDMTDNTSDKLNLALTSRQGWGTLKARAFYEQIEHEMDFGPDRRYWYGTASANPPGSNPQLTTSALPCAPIGPSCAAGMPMSTQGRNTGLTLQAELLVGGGDKVRVGAEYRAQRLDDWWSPSGAGMWPYTFWNIRDGERDRYGLFGEWEGRRGAWTHILGLRHETVQTDAGLVHGYNLDTFPSSGSGGMGNQTTDAVAFNTRPRARTDRNWDLAWLARFVADAGTSYELGLAQKTRSPGLYERYTWSTWQMAALMNNFIGDGNGYVGNPELKPEVARTLSLAADWHAPDGAWGLRISPHYSHVEDYIDAVCLANCLPNRFRILRYVNQSARLYGLDLQGHTRLDTPEGWGVLTLSSGLSYTRGENRDTGENLYNIMPLNARFALEQKVGRWTGRLEGQFVAAKDKVSAVRQEMSTDGYSLFHLRGSYQWKQVRLDMGIENLFDKAYDLPLGGAYVGQGTTMTLPPTPNQPQWGTPVPGPGRSVYLGVNVAL